MIHSIRGRHIAIAALTSLCLVGAGPAIGRTAPSDGAILRGEGPTQHEHTVETQPLRGDTFVCGDLTLRATKGRMTETNDADLRNGVVRISISRIWRRARFHGSDGRTYRASGVTAAWFVLHAPDFETPVRGLEISQVMFRGGPDKSPGWLREQIKWADKQETEKVQGPCDFTD